MKTRFQLKSVSICGSPLWSFVTGISLDIGHWTSVIWLRLCRAVFLMAFLGVLSLSGAPSGVPRLSLGIARGYPGVSVTVPLSFAASTNIVAMQADVLFDPAYLASPAVIPAEGLPHVLVSSQPAPGVRRILIYSLSNATMPTGTLAQISFQVIDGAPISIARLSFTNVLLVTAAAQPVPSTNFTGAIFVNPIYVRPDGDVQFFLAAIPGQLYWIQASTNLTSWETLATNQPAGSVLEHLDTDAHNYSYRFYRLLPVP